MEHMLYAKGISWIDDCRIPFVETDNTNNWTSTRNKKPDKTGCFFRGESGGPDMNNKGRFPANILVSDDMLNNGVISEGKDFILKCKKKNEIYANGKGFPQNTRTIKQDKGTNSRYYDIDKWFDNLLESCG